MLVCSVVHCVTIYFVFNFVCLYPVDPVFCVFFGRKLFLLGGMYVMVGCVN
jgi:hypothetical protein